MEITLHFENVGIGDCILIHIENDIDKYNILIDCGNYNDEVKQLFDKYKISILDSLIITHIDNDHILGLIDLLNENRNIELKQIWYNNFQHLPTNEDNITLDEKDRLNIASLYSELPSRLKKYEESKISVEKAMMLSDIIVAKEEWKQVWNKSPIMTNSSTNIHVIREGDIQILSPRKEELEALDYIFYKEFFKKMYKTHPQNSDLEDKEKLYELLLRIYDYNNLEDQEEYTISTELLTKATIQQKSKERTNIDKTETNRSSIAFIFSFMEKKILLLGDSAPDVVFEELSKIEGYESSIIFDAIKVSHHGSSQNITSELLSKIDSGFFIFTGGTANRPEVKTISKIINRPLPKGVLKRTLIFNKENETIKKFRENKSLQNEYKYDVIIDTQLTLS